MLQGFPGPLRMQWVQEDALGHAWCPLRSLQFPPPPPLLRCLPPQVLPEPSILGVRL